MPGYFRFRYFGKPWGIVPAKLSGTDLETALAAYLKADATVASIVAARVYPGVPPQTAVLPDLLYGMISGNGAYGLSGYSGISTARIRLTARSRRVRDCAQLREAVRQLAGFRGKFGPVTILFTRFEDVRDRYIDPIPGSDEGTFERQFDLRFKYRESIPSN